MLRQVAARMNAATAIAPAIDEIVTAASNCEFVPRFRHSSFDSPHAAYIIITVQLETNVVTAQAFEAALLRTGLPRTPRGRPISNTHIHYPRPAVTAGSYWCDR